MHVWCKFGVSSPNLWWVIARTTQISQNSESKWPKWPWRSRWITSIFHTSQEYPRMHAWCKFGDSSPNLWRVIVRTGQISYNSESKWPKWPWRSQSMSPFSIPAESIPWCRFGASLVILAQICDELSCGQGKVYGQADGQTQATTIPLRPERPRGEKQS